MDHRYALYNYQRLTELQALLDTVLGHLESGGTSAALLDSLQTQTDLFTRLLLNRPLASAGLAIGSTASKIKTAAVVAYINQGLFKSKGATDDAFTLSGTALNAGADTAEKCKFLLSLQADGTCVATQGPIVAAAATAVLPACPANETPIGYVEVETNAGTTFTPGTTLLSAAGITDTYVNLAWPNSGADAIAVLGAFTHPTDSALGTLPRFI